MTQSPARTTGEYGPTGLLMESSFAMGRRRCYGLVASGVLVTACGSGTRAQPASAPPTTVTATADASSTTATATTAATGTTATAAAFTATIEPLSDADRAAMTGVSWKPGCPVALDS